MCFDDPIYLDQSAFDDLVSDTEQNRICWMHHDILSDTKIARMFDQYAGAGDARLEDWTSMAWVAAGRQEGSFYLLFKWYADFYGPPERGDLYYIETGRRGDREARVRKLEPAFLQELGRQGQVVCQSFLSKVSENAIDYFGENEFEFSQISRILRLLDENPDQELEAFDWFFHRETDSQKAAHCATVAAFFRSVQTVEEIVYRVVETDGREYAVHHMHTGDFLAILNFISASIDTRRLPELINIFQELADSFCYEPIRAPHLGMNVGRSLKNLTELGRIRWLRIEGQGRQKLLRELYCRRAPRTAWEVFHRWQGDLYFTVLHRSPIRGLDRGVYLLSRFEDQHGMDVTDLFWLENIAGGAVHRCDGEFFEELMDLLIREPCRGIALHGGRRRSEDLLATYHDLLKEAFDKVHRGFIQRRPSEKEKIY
ncbi:MAG: hypothetical protein IJO69_02555 [Ruminiclostridium sp.]|nr:hypothetical protein [Ruminiclostridium sp.]MBQ9932698.1 hypothetical protein [Ruminiclostridium sp.]